MAFYLFIFFNFFFYLKWGSGMAFFLFEGWGWVGLRGERRRRNGYDGCNG